MRDRCLALERVSWGVGIVAMTLLISGCGDGRIEGDLTRGGDPAWKPRVTEWDQESGLRHAGGDGSAAVWAHAGQIEAVNNLSSGTISTATEGAGYACRRIQIHALEDHPLVGITAEKLVEELSAVPGVEAIVERGFASTPPAGESQPDLELWLRLSEPVSVRRDGDALRLQATLQCLATNHGWAFRCRFEEGARAPVVHWSWDGSLVHESTTTLTKHMGASAPALRLAAQNIASEIGKALTKHVTDLAQEHGPPPEIPPALRPAYQETPPIPWPPGLRATLLSSHVGSLTANRTTWMLGCEHSPRSLLTELQDALEAEGWHTAHQDASSENLPYLRMKREGAILHVEPLPSGRNSAMVLQEGEVPPYQRLCASYSTFITREELRSGIAGLDLAEADPEWLLTQWHLLGEERQRQLCAILTRRPPRTWKGMIKLGQLHHELGEKEQIAEVMARAGALAWLAGQQTDFASEWKKRAEEWEIPGDAPPAPTLDDLVAVGATSLQAGTELEREVDVGEELIVVHEEPDGIHATLFRIDPRPPELESPAPYALFRRNRAGGMTSWGHSPLGKAAGETQRFISISGGRVSADVTRVADSPPRFRLRLSLIQ